MHESDDQLPVPYLDRLSTKITIAATVFLVVLAAAVAFQVESGLRRNQYSAYTSSQNALEEQMKDDYLQSTVEQARLLASHLNLIASTAQASADFIEVQLAQNPASFINRPLVEEFFGKLCEQNQDITGLFFVNLYNEVIQASIEFSQPTNFISIPGTNQFDQIKFGASFFSTTWQVTSSTEDPQQYVLAKSPVFYEGQFKGVVIAALPIAHLVEHLESLQNVPGSYRLLFDSNSRILATGLQADQGTAQFSDYDLLAIRQALNKVSAKGPTAQTIELAGESTFIISVPLTEPAWRLVLVTPVKEIAQQSQETANTLWSNAEQTIHSTLTMIFVFFLCGLLVSLLIFDRLFGGRIANLVKGVRAITAGDLTVSVPNTGQDELGVLSRSINQMAGELLRRRGELLRTNAELQRSEEQYRSLAHDLEVRVEDGTREIKQLYDQSVARSQELELLYHADEQLYRHLQLNEVIQALADVVVDQLKADKTSVMIWDDSHQRLVIRGARGFSQGAIDRQNHYQPGEGIEGKVFQTGQVMVIEDTTVAPLPGNLMAQEESIRSILSVPITINDHVIGVFSMYSSQVRSFTPADIRLSQSLAQRSAIAIKNARLYEQVQQAATLEERQRLARELHDAITQSIYSLVLLAEAGRRYAVAGNLEQVEHHLGRLAETAQQALKEMRLLVYELRPLALAEVGLAEAIRQRLDTVEKRAGIQAQITTEGILDLPSEVEEQLYRIVQEALNNALKHARAGHVSVFLRRQRQLFEIEVRDDGMSFNIGEANGGGIGLSSMRERATRLGGQLIIKCSPGQGTSVLVQIDLDRLPFQNSTDREVIL